MQDETSKNDALIMSAFIKAAAQVGWQEADMATLLSKSSKDFQLAQKTGYLFEQHLIERQLLFLRACRSLHCIGGGDAGFMRHWFVTENTALNGQPSKLCLCVDGLNKVSDYLQLMETKC